MTRILFRNRWQATKLRGLQWLFLAIAAGTLWSGVDIAQTHGLRPADGGVLKPPLERAAMAALVVSLGVGSFGALVMFRFYYPVEIRRDGQRLEIDVLTMTGRRTHRFAVSAVRQTQDHEGMFMSPRGQSVHAPWLGLRVGGRRFPYVVDLQAEEVRIAEIEALAQPQAERPPKESATPESRG